MNTKFLTVSLSLMGPNTSISHSLGSYLCTAFRRPYLRRRRRRPRNRPNWRRGRSRPRSSPCRPRISAACWSSPADGRTIQCVFHLVKSADCTRGRLTFGDRGDEKKEKTSKVKYDIMFNAWSSNQVDMWAELSMNQLLSISIIHRPAAWLCHR